MEETKFKETEAKYREIKEKHARGEMSIDQVKMELKNLMVQDETGTYWMLGGKSGKWYRHDGTQWQETDPYEMIKAEAVVEEAEEVPLELDASAKISQEEEEEEEENPFDSKDSTGDADDAGIIFGSYSSESAMSTGAAPAAESAGVAEAAGTAEDANISYQPFATETVEAPGTGINGTGDTTIAADIPSSPFTAENADKTITADMSSSPFATESDETARAAEDVEIPSGINSTGSAETIDASAADISFPSNGAQSAEPIETPGAGEIEDSTYGTYDTFGTYEIDTTAADEAAESADVSQQIEKEIAEKGTAGTGIGSETLEDSAVSDPMKVVDTQKFEYTPDKQEEEPMVPAVESTEPALPVEPAAPVFPEPTVTPGVQPQDYITCGVCKSRIPPFAIYCTFCGAHQKTLKKGIPVKSMKEESELLVKSIKITSFLFFLGGLGLIIGLILGATFGVVKDFFSDLSVQLPLILRETRGGFAGGLIFACIGGFGGFFASAILSLILAGGYNLIAYIFGGIRFKVKR